MASSNHFASDARGAVSPPPIGFLGPTDDGILSYSGAQTLSRIAGCAVALVAVLVLIGWVLDIRILRSGGVPGWATMKVIRRSRCFSLVCPWSLGPCRIYAGCALLAWRV